MSAVWRQPKPALTVARAVLVAELPSVPVSTLPPDSRPDMYIVLGIVSSSYPNPAVTGPRVMVDCYAKSSLAAGNLADEALTAFLNARGEFGGAWVKKFAATQGPYPINDPDISDRFRFQFHGELMLSTR